VSEGPNFTFVGYDVITDKKSGPSASDPDRALCRQLDELERCSMNERDKHLGRDYFRDIKEFYSLEDEIGNFPSYRPRVRIPQLQTLVLNEATDITDSSPKIYIASEGQRDNAREKYYQANWRQGCYNNRILFAAINAMLSNLGFLQIGFSPGARRGKGRTWVESRDPETVLPDPYCTSEADWSWLQFYDFMYIDEVRRIWPDRGRFVLPKMYAAGEAEPYGLADTPLEFPEYSPLNQSGDNPNRKLFRSNRVRVRHTFLFDNTREKVKENLGTKTISAALVHPRFQYAYPDGRWVTDCEHVVLADGNNWCPQLPDDERGTFPLVRFAAMPTLHNFWGPPPVKLTRDLQNLSERIYAQITENIIRTNNGVIVIETNTGIDPQAIGWLPGEVLMINAGSKPPVMVSPQGLPQQTFQFPAALLALQKELQGFSGARQGEQGAGNVSPDLFDASLFQSQYQTRLRTRLMAESIQRLAQIIFYVEARYKGIADRLPVPDKGELKYVGWEPIQSLDSYDAYLDEGSLRVMSASAMRSVVGALAKAKMLPTSYILETLDIPNAKELAEENMRELELAAMSRLKKSR
jgi:hypothetical protein